MNVLDRRQPSRRWWRTAPRAARVFAAVLFATLLVTIVAALARPTFVRAPERDTVRVNEFLSYSLSERSVQVRVLAGYNAVNDSLNFNGGARGSHTIVVPLGWRVDLEFENLVGLPHSILLFAHADPVPETPQEAALADAHSQHHNVGLDQHEHQRVSFVAARAGSFLLLCGVPNHARDGMWVRFLISPDSPKPDYRR